MRIKICGLSRDEDIDIANECRPDYVGFVFTESSRKVTPVFAQFLRFRLINGIIPVGVFVDAPIKEVALLYYNSIISIAQLHGDEDNSYIAALKKASGVKTMKVIKAVKSSLISSAEKLYSNADYLLFDSGAGSGKTFNWNELNEMKFKKQWFLAGGINCNNIEQAMKLDPFAIDVSSGAETNGIKNRKKIQQLTEAVKGYIS
ncbi:MAG: phosphoribosylanthranilate isomerase [Treponema sp.]|nr:phosphoribosylanthranilate isomerase [Treponema sp.]